MWDNIILIFPEILRFTVVKLSFTQINNLHMSYQVVVVQMSLTVFMHFAMR